MPGNRHPYRETDDNRNIVFSASLVVAVLGVVIVLASGDPSPAEALLQLLAVVGAVLLMRLVAEAAILLFRIHDVLHEIADELSEANDRGAAVVDGAGST